MRRIALSAAVIAVTAGGILTGCNGGASSDVGAEPGDAGVQDVVPVFLEALADGDGPRACSLLTAAAQDLLILELDSADCITSVVSHSQRLGAEEKQALRDAEIRGTMMREAKATVSLTLDESFTNALPNGFSAKKLALSRMEEHWLIDAPPRGAR